METKRRTTRTNRNDQRGFTLVELLVVITIIGILAALITAAGAGALKTARQNAIKTEVDQITMGYQTFKDTYGAYPPNCQVDDINPAAGPEPATTPISESQVLTDLKRQFKQAFPRSREPDDLILALTGLAGSGSTASNLEGGISAGESVVFWLGGFSNDPKYPISGEGGPSYQIDASFLPPGVTAVQADPIDNRKWVFPFEVSRLRPRDSENYFDAIENRFIVYTVRINGTPQTRRINFWQYVPSKSERPYLYFDVSRHPATIGSGSSTVGPHDPPAATSLNPSALHVHAIKMRSESAGASSPIQFANKDKFQVLHSGVDEEWGEAFEQMSAHGVSEAMGDPSDPNDYLLYPDGPFTGDVADTLVNFSEGTLEASQP